MSPLALCKGCETEFDCVEEGCQLERRAGPQVFTLNEEQWDHFMYHMTHPKPPTPAMIAVARQMSEWHRRPGDLEYDSWASSLADILDDAK